MKSHSDQIDELKSLLAKLHGRAVAAENAVAELVAALDSVLQDYRQAPEPVVPRRRVERSLSQQCALRCREQPFWQFLGAVDHDDALGKLRTRLDIESRRELDSDPRAAAAWRELEADYLAFERGYR